MKGIFVFKVKGKGGNEGIWFVDAKNGTGCVKFGDTSGNYSLSCNYKCIPYVS